MPQTGTFGAFASRPATLGSPQSTHVPLSFASRPPSGGGFGIALRAGAGAGDTNDPRPSVRFDVAHRHGGNFQVITPRIAGLVTGALLAPLLAAVSAPASAAPTFTGTLAGPSEAAMYPSGEQYDAVNDRLVVADTGRDRVLFYSLAGEKLGGFGEYGNGPGQFASPRDVAVDEAGNIYVADAENNRIQVFTTRVTSCGRRVGWAGRRDPATPRSG